MILLSSVLAVSIVPHCLLKSQRMDLAKVLNKIKGFSGVIGYVIVDNQSNVVHTSLDKDDAIKLGAVVIKVLLISMYIH